MLRLGIIGTGRIASRFIGDAWQKNGFAITAVYNPRLESARRFLGDHADKVGASIGQDIPERMRAAMQPDNALITATDQWEEFIECVDAVYIAAPHSAHYNYARRLLEAGKHVLCEKPLALRIAEAEELYSLAKEKRVVLMEALKTAYCPGFQALLAEVQSGKIGEVKEVEACFTRLTPTNLREWTDLACGGSFTEFGSYVIYPVMKLLGTEFQNVFFHVFRGANGVDGYTRIFFDYGESFASCKTGLGVKSEGQMIISGTKGYIVVQAPWWLTRKYEVRYEDPNQIETYEFPYEGSGLQYECEAFAENIMNLKECSDEEDENAFWEYALWVTPTESIAMARVMESFLEQEFAMRGKDLLRGRGGHTV